MNRRQKMRYEREQREASIKQDRKNADMLAALEEHGAPMACSPRVHAEAKARKAKCMDYVEDILRSHENLRAVANALWKGPCERTGRNKGETDPTRVRCLDDPSVTHGASQLINGRMVPSKLPFKEYRVRAACYSCATYWYAEMAAQTAEEQAKARAEEQKS